MQQTSRKQRVQKKNAVRRTEDHTRNLMNRLYNSIESAAAKNQNYSLELARNDVQHVIVVGIPHFKYPILKVIIREPLPTENSYDESPHKAICIRFGPEELEMFNHGRDHELFRLEELIGKWLTDY